MKFVTVGDTHGRRVWRMIKGYKTDMIIFVGDYVDSFDVSNAMILHELKNIIQYKKDNPDKIILLWGNHDIQYALSNGPTDTRYRCSGYRSEMYFDLYELFRENFNLFQMAYQYKNYLWTHAGIHEGWYRFRFLEYWDKENETIAGGLNRMFEERYPGIFDVGRDRFGSAQVGGPLWVDKDTLWKKPIKQYHQIVGHSWVPEIKQNFLVDGSSVTFVDCLEHGDKSFYELEIL